MAKTVLGFDYGMKRIGVAIGQTLTKTAEPLTTLRAQLGEPKWEKIDKLINTWQPDALVIGIPVNMDGTEQIITHAARRFGEKLQERYQLPVHGTDERLTTVEAKARLFAQGGYKKLQKTSLDSVAAQIILESWLRQYGNDEP